MLPAVAFTDDEDDLLNLRNEDSEVASDDVIFDATGIVEALKGRGYDTKAIETPYEPRPASKYNTIVSR